MIFAVIVTLLFFGLVGFGAFMVMKKIKETDPSNVDTSISPNIDSSQEFMPFESIEDGLINIGNNRYRAIIECSSTNYNLKTQREKEIIEASFQKFLNSLSHPIWFFIQTRVIDNAKMIKQLEEELRDAVEKNPGVEEYANVYLNEMKQLNHSIGNNKQKKKYIVVPIDEVGDMTGLSSDEIKEHTKKQIYQRAYIICDELSRVGVRGRILSTPEIIELLHSCYHKDNYSDAELIAQGEFSTFMVEGRNILNEMPMDAKLDHILYEAQVRIEKEISSRTDSEVIRKDFEGYIRDLGKLRDSSGAYYKK